MSLTMKYFVLKPAGRTLHASASRRAMIAYATWLLDHDPTEEDKALALGLQDWVAREAAEVAPNLRLSDERGQY